MLGLLPPSWSVNFISAVMSAGRTSGAPRQQSRKPAAIVIVWSATTRLPARVALEAVEERLGRRASRLDLERLDRLRRSRTC